MAIEAKMGMCIVVILLSAFGFLVYRKFDARQRDLLQANLQAAEQSLPVSTEGDFVGDYSEFENSSNEVDGGPAQAVTELTTAADIELQDLNSAPTFGSTFALQNDAITEPAPIGDAETRMVDAGQGNPFDDNPFGNLSEPAASAAATTVQKPDDAAVLAFAAEPAVAEPAGRMAAPLDEYLLRRQAKETAQQQDSSVNNDVADSSFTAFGDPQQAAAATDVDTPAIGQKEDVSGLAEAHEFSDPQQLADSKAPPSFDSFPTGFEPDFDGMAANTNDQKTSLPDDPWVKTDSSSSAGQLKAFPSESSATLAETPSIETSSQSPLSKDDDQQTPSAFADFDSLVGDSKGTTVAAQPNGSDEVDWSSANLLSQNSHSEAASQPPGFADFAATDDSPFSGTENSNSGQPPMNPPAIADAEPQPLPEKFGQATSPLSETSGSFEGLTEASRPSLSPVSDLNNAADFGSRRGPSIDPTAVMDPLNSVAGDGQLAAKSNTPQPWQDDFAGSGQPQDVTNGRLPIEGDGATLVSRTNPTAQASQQLGGPTTKVDDGLVNSFSSDEAIQGQQFDFQTDRSLSAAERLRTPTRPSIQQALTSNGNAGKIQQVSEIRDPDGIYTVKPDDTYWTISKHVYGTARFFSSLALYNKNRIKDPRKLREGMKVVVPDPEVLIERFPELLQDYIPKKTMPSGYFLKPGGMPAYRIGERETLSEISQKHLGRASRWIQLYRMNQHVLKNPNRLKPGTVIDLPDDATNVHMVP